MFEDGTEGAGHKQHLAAGGSRAGLRKGQQGNEWKVVVYSHFRHWQLMGKLNKVCVEWNIAQEKGLVGKTGATHSSRADSKRAL